MSYTPTNWNTGDTITAAAMNKIENGIANAGGASGLITYENNELDKNFNELQAMLESGVIPFFVYEFEDSGETIYFVYHLENLSINEGDYMAFFTTIGGGGSNPIGFLASSATGTLVED